MKVTLKYGVLLGVVLLLAVGSALSKPNLTGTVDIAVVTTMPDGGQLQPGSYQVKLLKDTETPEVAFYKNDKLICRCPVKLEDLGQKVKFSQSYLDVGPNKTRFLQRLELAGWTQAIVFNNAAGPAESK